MRHIVNLTFAAKHGIIILLRTKGTRKKERKQKTESHLNKKLLKQIVKKQRATYHDFSTAHTSQNYIYWIVPYSLHSS